MLLFVVLLVTLACIIGEVAGDEEGTDPPETLAPAETITNTTIPVETETPPDAALILSLAANTSDGPVPLTVGFTGSATGVAVDLWNWTVDGVAADADGPNFTHTFTGAGTYTVALNATNTTVALTNTTSVEVVAEENVTAAPSLMASPVVLTTFAPITHPHIWNVSCIGTGNCTNISVIPDIGAGDTIRIWGMKDHTYEGGVTIDAPDVTVKQWEGSPAQPLITNTSNAAPAFTVTADNVTFIGVNISGNRLNGNGAGINVAGTDSDHHVQRLTIADCTFTGNSANGTKTNGSALYALYVDDLLVEGTVFTGNTALSGGGAYFDSCPNATLTGVTFTNNIASMWIEGNGGGAGFGSCADTTLTNCRFDNPTNIHARSSTGVLNTTRTPGTNIAGGPYLGGNLWLQGPAQDISERGTDADFDGICDQALTITNSDDGSLFGTDHLPLVYGGGTVQVNATPTGGFVFVDGTNTTRTANNTFYLPAGSHTLEVFGATAYGRAMVDVTAGTVENVTVIVLEPPVAGFTSTPTEGNAPLNVTFTDNSTGNVTAWLWNFGDGNTSIEQNPVHQYIRGGTFTVRLNVSNLYNTSTEERTVTVFERPAANFSLLPAEGNTPLTVNFTDTSAGNVTSWNWDFRDGNTSIEQNPIHRYEVPGTYTVSLNASNAYGFNVSTVSDAVSVLSPPSRRVHLHPE